MTYSGKVKDGVVVFDASVPIPDGTAVAVTILSNGATDEATDSLYDVLGPVIGLVDDMPEDSSINIDHYLYGHPKK
jgi:hypothetical protein